MSPSSLLRKVFLGLAALAVPSVAMAIIDVNKSFTPINIPTTLTSVVEITLLNSSQNFPVTGVALTDALPTGMTVVSVEPAVPPVPACGSVVLVPNTAISLSGGTIPQGTGGNSGICRIRVRVNAAVPGTYVNVIAAGDVSGTENGSTISNPQSAEATLIVNPLVPLTGSKSNANGANHLHIGGTDRVTITINNPNTFAVTGVGFFDTLPTPLIVQSPANIGGTCVSTGGGTVTLGPGTNLFTLAGATIAAGASCTVAVNITVDPALGATAVNGNVANTLPIGRVTSAEGPSNAVAISDNIPVQTGAAISKAFAPSTVQVGATSTLTLTLRNYNTTAISGASFTDTMPTGITVVGPATTSCAGGVAAFTATTLSVSNATIPRAANAVGNNSGSCTLTAPVTGDVTGDLLNAVPAGNLNGINYNAATATLRVINTVSLSKAFSPQAPIQGSATTLTITLLNGAGVPATITAFSDNLGTMGGTLGTISSPSTTCAGGTPSISGLVVTMNSGTIPAAGSCTVSVNINLAANASTGNRTNTIPAGVLQTNQGNYNLPTTGVLNVQRVATLDKSFTPAIVAPGGTSRLRVTVARNPLAPVFSSVQFTDSLPAGHTVAVTPNIFNSCGLPGSVTTPSSTSVVLTGGVLAAASCFVEVDVVAPNNVTAPNPATNRIAPGNFSVIAGGITYSDGRNRDAPLTRVDTTLLINKSFDPVTIAGGGFSTVNVLISNNQPGAIALSGVALTDNLPPNVQVFATPSPSFSGTGCTGATITAIPGANSFSLAGASVAANSVCTLSVRVTSTFDGNHINQIPAGELISREGVTNFNAVSATLTVQRNVSIQKWFTPTIIPAGGSSVLTLRIFNTNSTLRTFTPSGVVDDLATDSVPAGVTIAAAPAATTDCPSATLSAPPGGTLITVGSFVLAPNAFCDVFVPVTVVNPGAYVNTIPSGRLLTVEVSTNPDPAVATLTAVNQPTIAKAFAPTSIPLAATSTVTFTIVNASDLVPLTGGSFADTLPANMQVSANAAAGGTCVGAGSNFFLAGQTGTLNFSGLTIPFGPTPAERTCTVEVVVTTTAPGTFDNQATGFVSTQTPTPVNSPVVTLTVLANRPTISKSFAADPIPLGAPSTLTFTLSNTNAVAAALPNDAFRDVFPTTPGAMTVAAPPAVTNTCSGTLVDSGGNALAAGDVGVRYNGGSIPANGSCTISVNVTTNAAGVYNNTSTVLTTSNAGISLLPATDTLTVTPPVLSVGKTINVNPIVLGGTAAYTVIVSNSSDPGTGRTQGNLTITDELEVDISLLNTTGSDPGWSCLGTQDLVCTYTNTLAAGASTTLLLNVAIGEAALTGNNTARVSGGADPLCPAPPAVAAPRCSATVTASVVPVVLSLVDARVEAGDLLVRFGTAAEMGTLGFRVLAANSSDPDDALPLGQALTRANGRAFAAQEYAVRDRFNGQTHVWIEELTLAGKRIAYGPFPVGVIVGGRDEAMQIPWASIRAEQASFRAAQAAAVLRTQQGAAVQAEVKVDRSGWTVVSFESLLAAGIDWSAVPAERIRLRRGELPIPLQVDGPAAFGPGSRLAFLGQAIDDSLYTKTAVYRLSVESAAQSRLASVHAVPANAVAAVTAVPDQFVHAPNRLYAPYAATDDPWYAAEAYRDGPNLGQLQETFTLPEKVSAANEKIEVLLWGGTTFPEAPDHSVRIKLNGQTLVESTFDGASKSLIQADLPPGLLVSGPNVLTVQLLNNDLDYDLVMLESIRVDYTRKLVAVADRLSFAGTVDAVSTAAADRMFADAFDNEGSPACVNPLDCDRYVVGGFTRSDVVVLRERGGTVEHLSRVKVSATGATYNLDFSTTRAPGDRFWVEPESGVAPLATAPVLPTADPLAGGPAQYLIISHPSFIGGLAPLIAARQAEGLSVRVIDVESLLRAYNDGVFDPVAIQRAIADAHGRLGTRYVLLVGGDSFDYFNYSGVNSISFVPTFYRQTDVVIRFGPADSVHADVDLDGLPDVALGRFPVRTLAEVDNIVQKTLAYAQADHGRKLLLQSDRSDPLQFKAQIRPIEDGLPGWASTRLELDDYAVGAAGTLAARNDLIGAVNAGQALLAYMGHSGPNRWTFSGLLSAQQVYAGAFSNATRPTLTWHLGCYGSFFTQPSNNTIAHGLMLQPGGGAAAVLGASGLTQVSSDIVWINTMMLYLPSERVGDALKESQRLMHMLGPEYDDISIGGNLLGDPALRLRQ